MLGMSGEARQEATCELLLISGVARAHNMGIKYPEVSRYCMPIPPRAEEPRMPETGMADGHALERRIHRPRRRHSRRSGVTAIALTELMLERIARHDGRLHAYAAVAPDQARAMAAAGGGRDPRRRAGAGRCTASRSRSKDVFYTTDIVTGLGSSIYAGLARRRMNRPRRARLREAGAVMLGKLTADRGRLCRLSPLDHRGADQPLRRRVTGQAPRRAGPASPRRRAWLRQRSAPTPAARSACPRPAAG